jgi:hypothetical protein
VYSSLFYSSNSIRDIAMINTKPDNVDPGFYMQGGAGVQIERVYSHGWRNHYLLDQASLISIDHCYLGGINFDGRPEEHENGVVFQDPPGDPINAGGSCNVNSVSRCTFNLRGNPVIFKGDIAFVMDRCYINGGSALIVGGRRVSVLYSQFERVQGDECILVDAPGETGAISLEITGCFFAKDVAAVRFNTRTVNGFTFNGNVASTNNKTVDGVVTEQRHVIENLPLQLQGPLIILGNTAWGDAAMVAHEGLGGEVMLYASSAYSAGPGLRDRIGVGTIQPQATLDIFGGAEGPDAGPQYGLQVRTELGPVLRQRMAWPPVPAEN